jgi:steroid delta-isomerase-like uncharacterized protein
MDNVQLFKKNLDDFAAGRWDAYQKDLAHDVVYEEIATGTRCQGADEFIAALKKWKRAFPDVVAQVKDVQAAGDRVMAEIEWIGTQTGPFDGPFGTIAPSNNKGTLKAAMIVRIANGKIAESHHYFDLVSLLTQMGAIPAMGAGAQPRPGAGVSPPTRHP